MTLCAWPGGAEAQVDELPDIVEMTAEQAEEAARVERERLAMEQLQTAKLAFERGEFERADKLFRDILGVNDIPVALSNADDLHDGFLHHAFTLVLNGNTTMAFDQLEIALQLKPGYAPSPVTTRPDLLEFYERRQRLFLGAGGTQKLPSELFPELATDSRVVRTRRELPLPLFGVRLRQLGRPTAGNALLGIEIGSATLNAAGWILWGAVFQNLGPSGDSWRQVFFVTNPISFGVFWTTIAVELIVTAVLNRRAAAARVGELAPFEGRWNARQLRREARDRHARRRAGLRMGFGAGGVVVTAW